jgi:UDP-GlcNAc:undecaprenyl-phosphate GlcNAc-1-phosphate transferase
MSFPLNAYLSALVVSWVAAFALLPLWEKFCLRTSIVDDPGHRKIHERTIPLAGGLTIFSAMGLALGLGWVALVLVGAPTSLPPGTPPPLVPTPPPSGALFDVSSGFLLRYGFDRRALQLTGVLLGAGGMLIVGLVDDRFELRPSIKFGGQLLIALLVAATGVRVTLFVPSAVFSYAVTVLWILTVVNAFNFMDNMNGLCSGLGAISAACFGGIAAMKGQYLVALLAFAALGALLGFLPHNFPKARSFLGDGGSHLVGYLLSVLAILPHFHTQEDPHPLAVLTPLLVLAVPLLDLVWVVILRWRIGQPFYHGDTNHLSHRLVRLGLSRVQAVGCIWLLALAAGGLAFLL